MTILRSFVESGDIRTSILEGTGLHKQMVKKFWIRRKGDGILVRQLRTREQQLYSGDLIKQVLASIDKILGTPVGDA